MSPLQLLIVLFGCIPVHFVERATAWRTSNLPACRVSPSLSPIIKHLSRSLLLVASFHADAPHAVNRITFYAFDICGDAECRNLRFKLIDKHTVLILDVISTDYIHDCMAVSVAAADRKILNREEVNHAVSKSGSSRYHGLLLMMEWLYRQHVFAYADSPI